MEIFRFLLGVFLGALVGAFITICILSIENDDDEENDENNE